MSDDRGPPIGPGDELPDVAPRTGPPTRPVIAPVPAPVAAPTVEAPSGQEEADAAAALAPADDAAMAPISELQELAVPAREEITTEARNIVHAPESGWSAMDLDALFASQVIEAPELVARSEPWTAPPEVQALPEAPPVMSAMQEQIGASEAAPSAPASEPATDCIADIPIQEAPEPVAEPAAVESLGIDAAEAEAVTDPAVAPELYHASLAAPDLVVEPIASAPIPSPLIPSVLVPPILAAPAATPPPPTFGAPPLAPVATAPEPRRSVWARRFRRAVLILMALAVGYAVLVLSLIAAYRWVDPPRSALMIATRLSGQPVVYGPVPITSISSYLQRAVVTSEDARFCYHRGVDWAALYEAMNESRGGSTITMQVAKNLFLWSSRSYVRKAIEIPVALTIDAVWPKRRILEVYLNIAEWGPGIFGAEAASYYHFDKPASRLTAQEAALLAASLPNPIARDAGEPGRITALLASRLRGRMAHSDAFVSCLGLRPLPRAEPKAPARPVTRPAARPSPEQRPTTKAEPQLKPWQTTTEPAFNPWQN